LFFGASDANFSEWKPTSLIQIGTGLLTINLTSHRNPSLLPGDMEQSLIARSLDTS
jgi:hypothetical protein